MNIKNNNKKTKIYLALTIVIVVITIGFFVISRSSKTDSNIVDGINYGPPTEQEQNSGNEKKTEIVENSLNEKNDNTASDSSDIKVDIVIVDAGQYDDSIEVRAFASNVIKDGNCTFTFSKSDKKISKVLPAYADASTTPCVNLALSRNEFNEIGTWDVDVTYNSVGYLGSSKTTLEIK
jgi:lipopolysaccharide export LptBFGC system permease protein LptF